MLPLINSALSFASEESPAAFLRLPSGLVLLLAALRLVPEEASSRLSTPMCVHSSPESTCGSRLHSPSGSVPTRRPDFCWVRRIVSPLVSTTQTVASHWAVLEPMSATSSVEGILPEMYSAKFSAMNRPLGSMSSILLAAKICGDTSE